MTRTKGSDTSESPTAWCCDRDEESCCVLSSSIGLAVSLTGILVLIAVIVASVLGHKAVEADRAFLDTTCVNLVHNQANMLSTVDDRCYRYQIPLRRYNLTDGKFSVIAVGLLRASVFMNAAWITEGLCSKCWNTGVDYFACLDTNSNYIFFSFNQEGKFQKMAKRHDLCDCNDMELLRNKLWAESAFCVQEENRRDPVGFTLTWTLPLMSFPVMGVAFSLISLLVHRQSSEPGTAIPDGAVSAEVSTNGASEKELEEPEYYTSSSESSE